MYNAYMKYLAVLDFEATCWATNDEHEIIEFPTVIVDIAQKMIVDEFRTYVKPVQNPILSDFCKALTGIQQENITDAPDLVTALKMHRVFMSKWIPESIFVTCGDWDLKTMLPIETERRNIIVPKMYNKWINIKNVFHAQFPDVQDKSMPGMLKALNLALEGRHHSGLDDCKNIARIAIELLKKTPACFG